MIVNQNTDTDISENTDNEIAENNVTENNNTNEDIVDNNIVNNKTLNDDNSFDNVEYLISKEFENLDFPDIKFRQNTTTIVRGTDVKLINVAYYLMLMNQTASIEIQGHTDNSGSKWYNMNLSKRRAETVKLMLIEKGIDAKRIKIKGFGASKPIDTNEYTTGRANNRRVEFMLIK